MTTRPEPPPLARVVVVGTSGAGKTRFARDLAAMHGLPHVELDALHWAPHWTPRRADEFVADVRAAAAGACWVADGNYSAVRGILWPRATHVVWLNYGRFTVLSRVVLRTVRRAFSRQPLWAGNRETLGRALFSRHSIVLWSLTTYGRNCHRFAALRADPQFGHLVWHELRSPRQAREYLRAARDAAARPSRPAADPTPCLGAPPCDPSS